jgi:hypothetical protein
MNGDASILENLDRRIDLPDLLVVKAGFEFRYCLATEIPDPILLHFDRFLRVVALEPERHATPHSEMGVTHNGFFERAPFVIHDDGLEGVFHTAISRFV